MPRTRVVVAGLGDTGLIAAVNLAHHHDLLDVVGISPTPGLLSGRELGLRLTQPDAWARRFRFGFHRFPGLDRARTVHGAVVGVDLDERTVAVRAADGTELHEPFDQLVVATGVRSGFWRRPEVRHDADVDAELRATRDRLVAATSLAVVGGGATAVNSAAQVARSLPRTRVDLYFPGERALPHHHPRVWEQVRPRLERLGVGLHAGHRAALPTDTGMLTAGPVAFTTGRLPRPADVVLWAVGGGRPNTGWLPRELLTPDGYVPVDPQLRVPGRDGLWAVGDVAATDPHRGSARNSGGLLLARNVAAALRGRRLRAYRPARWRWGSVLGPLDDGMDVFTPGGRGFRIPMGIVHALEPWTVGRALYRSVRD